MFLRDTPPFIFIKTFRETALIHSSPQYYIYWNVWFVWVWKRFQTNCSKLKWFPPTMISQTTKIVGQTRSYAEKLSNSVWFCYIHPKLGSVLTTYMIILVPKFEFSKRKLMRQILKAWNCLFITRADGLPFGSFNKI